MSDNQEHESVVGQRPRFCGASDEAEVVCPRCNFVVRFALDKPIGGTFAMVDRARGKLTVWRETPTDAAPEVLVKHEGLVCGLHGAEGRTWEAVVGLLNALGVVVEERT